MRSDPSLAVFSFHIACSSSLVISYVVALETKRKFGLFDNCLSIEKGGGRSSVEDLHQVQLFVWRLQKKACCLVFDCLNGTACSPFKNYFQRLNHNALNTRNNGKTAKLPKVKLDFARRSFYFLGASIFNSLPLSLRKPWRIITCEFFFFFFIFILL